ncbi:MAG: thioesterase family protein [Phycisphaerae bacterium]
MKPGLTPGIHAEVRFEVTEAMCPAFEGEVVHRVCATWTLVHYMEVAGRKILVQYLEPGEEGVGSHVSCDHRAPAPVGREVRMVATVTAATARELACGVEAFVENRLIATGKTVQRILPRELLSRLLHERDRAAE